MQRRQMMQFWLVACVCTGGLPAQSAAKVEFGKDVLPILRQNCIPCHGPTQQINGLRLDRKSSVIMSGRRVVPGSSENSFLYHRLIGTEYGTQMPPTGKLRDEKIAIIKAWIDQGAEWPSALSNEVDLPPLNQKAIAMVEALRTGEMGAFTKFAAEDASLLNARGPGGATPFMYAVLYADTATLTRLLKQGADVNRRNDVGATALIWAVPNLEKTRLLLDHGADVNARSDEFRTPLMIASRQRGGAALVKLLLDRGANLNPNGNPGAESSPLVEAVTAGDLAIVQMLMEHGADAKAAGPVGLVTAASTPCFACLEMLAAKITEKMVFTAALPDVTGVGEDRAVRLMLDRGADVNFYDPLGRTALMYAAGSDLIRVDLVKLLIERGADVNAKDRHDKGGDSGLTVLDIARLHGETPVVQLLAKAGAKGTAQAPPVLRVRTENTIHKAIAGSLPLLQRADANFTPKAGCISCHNNSMTAMAVGLARKGGFQVNEALSAQQVKANVNALEKLRDRLYQGFFLPVGDFFAPVVLGYILMGLEAEHYKADLNTDAVVMYLKMRQSPDGQWDYPTTDTRPPICSSYVSQTAIAMRGLQLYAPKGERAAYDRAIELAAAWIARARPLNNEDRSWRVLGLAWAAKDKTALQKAVRELLAAQRSDGGWADLESMESNVYATGKALVALQTAGMPVSDAVYKRGVRYLLKTQLEDGSWHVKSRALTFQPYFDAGFPHGFDQWMSAAGSGWATMALTLASTEGQNSPSSARLR